MYYVSEAMKNPDSIASNESYVAVISEEEFFTGFCYFPLKQHHIHLLQVILLSRCRLGFEGFPLFNINGC